MNLLTEIVYEQYFSIYGAIAALHVLHLFPLHVLSSEGYLQHSGKWKCFGLILSQLMRITQ